MLLSFTDLIACLGAAGSASAREPRNPAVQRDAAAPSRETKFHTIVDSFTTLDQVTAALRKEGLESSNLIVAVDFTKVSLSAASTHQQYPAVLPGICQVACCMSVMHTALLLLYSAFSLPVRFTMVFYVVMMTLHPIYDNG